MGPIALAPHIEARAAAAVRAIIELAPDVVGIQEAWDDNLAERVCRELSSTLPYSTRSRRPSGFPLPLGAGLILLSRWPMGRIARTTFGHVNIWFERLIRKGAIAATIDTPEGPFWAATAHAAAVREAPQGPRPDDRAARDSQILDLLAWLDQVSDSQPWVLLSDLNLDMEREQSGAAVSAIRRAPHVDAFSIAAGDLPFTFDPPRNILARSGSFKTLAPERVDLVLASRGRAISYRRVFTEVEPVVGTTLSDHFGVLAEVDI